MDSSKYPLLCSVKKQETIWTVLWQMLPFIHIKFSSYRIQRRQGCEEPVEHHVSPPGASHLVVCGHRGHREVGHSRDPLCEQRSRLRRVWARPGARHTVDRELQHVGGPRWSLRFDLG